MKIFFRNPGIKNGIFEKTKGKMRLYFSNDEQYIESQEGIDLSISFGGEEHQVNAWYLDDPLISPVKSGDFIGSVGQGAPVNFNNIFFNPHAHVTHTESLGHITKDFHSVNTIVQPLFYTARVITLKPIQHSDGDQILTLAQLKASLNGDKKFEAIIIRTLPNTIEKKNRKYSHSNPPYLESACALFLREIGVMHLLVDLPSVDKEVDGGELAFHHAFWGVPENPDFQRTITEFVYIPESCEDGDYLLNLQVAPIENDASPSRPVIYKVYHK
jgi:arylformamidase